MTVRRIPSGTLARTGRMRATATPIQQIAIVTRTPMATPPYAKPMGESPLPSPEQACPGGV